MTVLGGGDTGQENMTQNLSCHREEGVLVLGVPMIAVNLLSRTPLRVVQPVSGFSFNVSQGNELGAS